MKPTFFIIGAPKAGTTALASYFAQHPRVTMCRLKEPHFFNTDHGHTMVETWDDYLDLFYSDAQNIEAVGEASVWYLYSQVAISSIEQNIENARYIVMLRNPYTLVTSLHAQHLYATYEDIIDFNLAWNAQADRSLSGATPRNCPSAVLVNYAAACRLGEQLQGLYNKVPKERVHIVYQEDFQADPRGVWLGAQQFLNVSDDGRTEFPKENVGKRLRFR